MMIEIPIWLLVVLIATNIFVWLFILLSVYFVFGVLDLTYHKRHKQSKEEQNCPYEVENDDTKD